MIKNKVLFLTKKEDFLLKCTHVLKGFCQSNSIDVNGLNTTFRNCGDICPWKPSFWLLFLWAKLQFLHDPLREEEMNRTRKPYRSTIYEYKEDDQSKQRNEFNFITSVYHTSMTWLWSSTHENEGISFWRDFSLPSSWFTDASIVKQC